MASQYHILDWYIVVAIPIILLPARLILSKYVNVRVQAFSALNTVESNLIEN